MRIALMILLLACPLLAQEKPKAPDRAQVMKWLMQLSDKDAAKRKEAEAALRKITPDQWIAAVRKQHREHLLFAFPGGQVHGLRVLIDPGGAREIISGTWTDDDSQITYKLKSLGKGRYSLTGERKVGEKLMERIADEGTMAELKKRYEFLKADLAIRVPSFVFSPRAGRGLTTALMNPMRRMSLIESLGIAVRPPSEDLAYHLYLPRGVGFVVASVPPGSVAEKLGLEKFDVITKLDGKWLEKRAQLEVKTGTLEYVRRARTGQLKLE